MQTEDVGMMRAGNETRKGDWMETFSGIRFFPLDPRPGEVRVLDIAHHLSRINRYGGAIKLEHYSVAEHCVAMAKYFEREFPDEPMLAYQALHHDDCEAYIGDMVRPLKRQIVQFEQIEMALWRKAVAPALQCPWQLDPRVKEADNRILVNERRDVMQPSGNEWGIDHLEPLPGVTLNGLGPMTAKMAFLGLHKQLAARLFTPAI